MSLRTRLFLTHALIVFICLSLVAISVTVLLRGYRDRLAMERLDNVARPISIQVNSLAVSQVTSKSLLANIEEQATKNNVYIILGNSEGNIVRQVSPKVPSGQQLLEVPAGTLPRQLKKPAQGQFETADGRTFIFAVYPLAKTTSATDLPADTLILATPQTRSLAVWASLFGPFMVAGLIALGFSLIAAFLLARSMYRPLKRVTNAAQEIARGQYDQRIPVSGSPELRELATSFNHMAEEVKCAQQHLRHFVADVSHELKSPLTSIQGFAQALVDGTASDEDTRLKAVTIINDESRRMRRQVDELLELARVQSGQFRMNRELVDVNELIEHCREVFAVQAKDKGIELKVDTERLPMVTGDVDRLEQVLCNLVDNAIKNSSSGGEVQIVGRHPEPDHIEIVVTDNGPGIPSDQLSHVFERFYQVTGVRTGVGLGLAIAKEIVQAHGGTIEARSQPGEGAEFVVRLPVTTSG